MEEYSITVHRLRNGGASLKRITTVLRGVLVRVVLGPILSSGSDNNLTAVEGTGEKVVPDKLPELPARSVLPRGWIVRQVQEDAKGRVRVANQMRLGESWDEGIAEGWTRGVEQINPFTVRAQGA